MLTNLWISGNAIFPGAMPGYVPPYWNGAPSPCAMPFRNPYGNHAMTAFGANMVPPAPYAVPTYMPSMCYSFPSFGYVYFHLELIAVPKKFIIIGPQSCEVFFINCIILILTPNHLAVDT